MHKPVLIDSVLSHLNLSRGEMVLDGTIGSGGHALAILKLIAPEGLLIGLDQDQEALQRAQEQLAHTGGQFILKRFNFRHLDQALSELNIHKVNAVLLDVGVSSDQLDDPSRGFSFMRQGPLDMRMDRDQELTAQHLVLAAKEEELIHIFRFYGEEKFSRPIVRAILRERMKGPIATTTHLKEVIEQSVPTKYRFGRIHPATRVFQALRIAVNDELGALKEALPKAFEHLSAGGRLAVISFHSLEDRIVKQFFVSKKNMGAGTILTKKPVEAADSEVQANPRSRSAKLRVMLKRAG